MYCLITVVRLSSIKDEVDEISTTRDRLEKVEVSGLAFAADYVIDDLGHSHVGEKDKLWPQ